MKLNFQTELPSRLLCLTSKADVRLGRPASSIERRADHRLNLDSRPICAILTCMSGSSTGDKRAMNILAELHAAEES